MSTFEGAIKEIPGISVDFFKESDRKCYFLSHCHTDHMVGLWSLQTDVPIYATSISALLVQKKFPHLKDNVRTLEIGQVTSVELRKDDGGLNHFTVTAIPAGHCPGSCMLLFQIEGCDILYTGDFRMSLKNIKNLKLLTEIRSHDNLVVYLDSTFMKTTFPSFPSQTDSVIKITDLARDFLKKSMNHKVVLDVPARYGYEYLLMELSAKLNEKIFIHEREVYEQYLCISGLDGCVTMNQRNARILLKPKFLKSPTKAYEHDVILCLQLSAWYWSNWDGKDFVKNTFKNTFRVCYATHNSFNEIKEFLLFLKPKTISLNVLPQEPKEKAEMMIQLKRIQAEYLRVDKQEISKMVLDEPKAKFRFKRIRSMTHHRDGDEPSLNSSKASSNV